jgi:zinc and cadmium transporter
MDSLLIWIIVFSLLGGVLSVLLASTFLMLPDRLRVTMVPRLVSYAIGSLLGAAFLALLPHALTSPGVTDPHQLLTVVLVGILVFFSLEKLVLWRHCHSASCEAHGHGSAHHHKETDHAHESAANLILVGDAVHNLVDGVLIAAAFLNDFDLGVVTAFAVIAHEIPQEVGDFAILLQGGFSRGKALLFNILASVTTVVGAVATYFFLAQAMHLTPYFLAIAASSFLYIAVADLIPGLHRKVDVSATVQQLLLIAAGVLTIYIAHASLH